MKIRQGFVSNSSSSSFILKKSGLTDDQIDKIINHVEHYQLLEGWEDCEWLKEMRDEWNVEVDDDFIKCSTFMDNFDLIELMHVIGIPKENFVDVDESNDSFERCYTYNGKIPDDIVKKNVLEYFTNLDCFKELGVEEQQKMIESILNPLQKENNNIRIFF